MPEGPHNGLQVGDSDFSNYLRSGKPFRPIELKFNPYHDPDDGRFTFAPGGPIARSRSGRSNKLTTGARTYPTTDARNPKNHMTYMVRPGDTLGKIALLRRGLAVADLKWLNEFSDDGPLRIGQPIKLPHQAFLDAGRNAKNKFLALDYYMRTHPGRLPPDSAQPPSLADQLADPANWRLSEKNGYKFYLDPVGRTRLVTGMIVVDPTQGRSRTAQAKAGGGDRLAGDQGGHYVARRFKGPIETFNHFAQNGNFNRSAYFTLENLWQKNTKLGKKVDIRIKVHYRELSSRPASLEVHYSINGLRFLQTFQNQRGLNNGRYRSR